MVKGSKPIRSVLITDVDNTLFDWVNVWHAAFSAMLAELLRLSRLDEATLLSEIRKVHQRVGTSEYRSEEHTSELQSLMRTSYAVFCLKKKNKIKEQKSQIK